MRRLPALALMAGLSAIVPAAFSQEKQPTDIPEATAPNGEAHPSDEEDSGLQVWKWANFVVLAAGIGYLAGKNAGPMFAARSKQIRKDIIEADEARKQAEERAAAVERRLANLEAEIAALRAESTKEAEAETQRVAKHTAAEIAKVQAHAEQEIAAAGKAARLELKRYSAHLAIELAERKIRDRMTPDTQNTLVQGFVRNLQ